MKDDAPTPAEVPTKRRHFRQALDRWLIEWLLRDDLTSPQTREIERERARRKARRPAVVVGVLAGREGMTPEQREYVRGYVLTLDPTLVQTGTEAEHRMVIKTSSVVLAAPRARAGGAVWDAVRYARHRNVPVHVVLPNGEEAS